MFESYSTLYFFANFLGWHEPQGHYVKLCNYYYYITSIIIIIIIINIIIIIIIINIVIVIIIFSVIIIIFFVVRIQRYPFLFNWLYCFLFFSVQIFCLLTEKKGFCFSNVKRLCWELSSIFFKFLMCVCGFCVGMCGCVYVVLQCLEK